MSRSKLIRHVQNAGGFPAKQSVTPSRSIIQQAIEKIDVRIGYLESISLTEYGRGTLDGLKEAKEKLESLLPEEAKLASDIWDAAQNRIAFNDGSSTDYAPDKQTTFNNLGINF